MWQQPERMLSPRAWLLGSQVGAALIDVIIAVAIFGVAAPAMLSALGLLVRAEERSREEVLLTNLAQNRMETAKQQPYQEKASFGTFRTVRVCMWIVSMHLTVSLPGSR